MNGITSIIGVHPNNGWHTIANCIMVTRITSWAELLSAFQAEEFLCGVHLMVQKFYDSSSTNSAEMTNFASANESYEFFPKLTKSIK